MRLPSVHLLALMALLFLGVTTQGFSAWQDKRSLPSDLEVSGSLAGLPPESVRYISRAELLKLPQVSFTVSNDPNFTGPTKIQGVQLEDLARRLSTSAASEMAVAICDDGYRANYPHAYLVAHRPVLVMEVNGQPPAGWPKDSQEHTFDMGPYMISHPRFTPGHKILSHVDEAQIPWGVVGIEFRDEKIVFGAIAPRGPHAQDRQVQDGFHIAEQNCFLCHNSGSEGGRKSGISWDALAAFASSNPKDFAAYVRAPSGKNPRAQMPGNPQYDDATLAALAAYFQTFSGPHKP